MSEVKEEQVVERRNGLPKYCTCCDNRELYIKRLISYNGETKRAKFSIQCAKCGIYIINIVQNNVPNKEAVFKK